MHFTPTSASSMNLVEVWFGIIERQALRRGVFRGVGDLNTKIRAFTDGCNDRCHPFVWAKTAEEILAKADRRTTSATNHLFSVLRLLTPGAITGRPGDVVGAAGTRRRGPGVGSGRARY